VLRLKARSKHPRISHKSPNYPRDVLRRYTAHDVAMQTGFELERASSTWHDRSYLVDRPPTRCGTIYGCVTAEFISSVGADRIFVWGTTHASSSGPTVFWWNSVGLVSVCSARTIHRDTGVKRRPCYA
jgi:hypothetical protein